MLLKITPLFWKPVCIQFIQTWSLFFKFKQVGTKIKNIHLLSSYHPCFKVLIEFSPLLGRFSCSSDYKDSDPRTVFLWVSLRFRSGAKCFPTAYRRLAANLTTWHVPKDLVDTHLQSHFCYLLGTHFKEISRYCHSQSKVHFMLTTPFK